MASLADLARAVSTKTRLFVLTGAGCSTASGIPDYRDDARQWKHRQPMTLEEFTGSELNRRRYWARSSFGWLRIRDARPNPAHVALRLLEGHARLSLLVTQNVDALHQKAGSENVVDLHGRLDAVECLRCRAQLSREAYQASLVAANPNLEAADAPAALRAVPDGDADLGAFDYERFVVPGCERCGGFMKPAVVFFGEAVPKERVARAYTELSRSDALLVVGSSLSLFSGFRFVKAAFEAGTEIFLLNRGETRADALATLRVNGDCAELLPGLAELVCGAGLAS